MAIGFFCKVNKDVRNEEEQDCLFMTLVQRRVFFAAE